MTSNSLQNELPHSYIGATCAGELKRYDIPFHGKLPTSLVLPSHYSVDKVIGAGAFGRVVRASDNRFAGSLFAVKVIAVRGGGQAILREFSIIKSLKHSNLLSLHDVFHFKAEMNNSVCFVFPLMSTTLLRVIQSVSYQDLRPCHFVYWTAQILRGVAHLHASRVLHRDLKPDNILINRNCDLKICDFGMSRCYYVGESRESSESVQSFDTELDVSSNVSDASSIASSSKSNASSNGLSSRKSQESNPVSPSNARPLTDYVVTRWYRPPELLFNCKNYTYAIDMWAVGCILAEMIGRQPLFQGQSNFDQYQCILNVIDKPDDDDLLSIQKLQPCDATFKELNRFTSNKKRDLATQFPGAQPDALGMLDKLLVFDPTKRLTAEDALRHSYVRNKVEELDGWRKDAPATVAMDNIDQLSVNELEAELARKISEYRKATQTQEPRRSKKLRTSCGPESEVDTF